MDALAPLADRLNALCDAQPFETGWYLKDLATGHTADRRGDVVVPSASTRKIAILMAALRAVHAGRLSLDQPVVIRKEFQISDSGCFQLLRPGFTITLQDVLTMMMVVSDNTCTGTVVEMLGLDDINQFSRAAGMTGTAHRQPIPAKVDPVAAARETAPPDLDGINVTTPKDAGGLLEQILRGAPDSAAAAGLGTSPALCRVALDIMRSLLFHDRLPGLLPRGTTVAHKTGTAAHNFNDAGIVFEDARPLFILAVYTDRVPWVMPDGAPGERAAAHHIARLCRMSWDALKRDEAPAYTSR
ncbi:MAG TPA: serine hydrolase [bacterium]|nr:serine hydrolase [bacterium]